MANAYASYRLRAFRFGPRCRCRSRSWLWFGPTCPFQLNRRRDQWPCIRMGIITHCSPNETCIHHADYRAADTPNERDRETEWPGGNETNRIAIICVVTNFKSYKYNNENWYVTTGNPTVHHRPSRCANIWIQITVFANAHVVITPDPAYMWIGAWRACGATFSWI